MRNNRNQQEVRRSGQSGQHEQPYSTPFGSAFPSDYEQRYSHFYSSTSSPYHTQQTRPTDRSFPNGVPYSAEDEKEGFHSTSSHTFSSSYSQRNAGYSPRSFSTSSSPSSKGFNPSFISSRLPRQESKKWIFMVLFIDYYSILGVSKTSSEKEVRKAYLLLAKQYHPDKNPSPEAQVCNIAVLIRNLSPLEILCENQRSLRNVDRSRSSAQI